MNIFYWRFESWIGAWLDVVCGAISVLTFTFYRPMWDFTFRVRSSKKAVNRLMRPNVQVQPRTEAGEARCSESAGTQG